MNKLIPKHQNGSTFDPSKQNDFNKRFLNESNVSHEAYLYSVNQNNESSKSYFDKTVMTTPEQDTVWMITSDDGKNTSNLYADYDSETNQYNYSYQPKPFLGLIPRKEKLGTNKSKLPRYISNTINENF